MKHMIPYEKLSKKERRRLDQEKRGTWGNVNPVTRVRESAKRYNRKRVPGLKADVSSRDFSES